MYIYIYIYICVCVCVYIYIHTHGKVFPVHIMKGYIRGGLLGSEGLTSCSTCFTPVRESKNPLHWRLAGTHSQSGNFGEEKNILPPAAI